MKAIGLGKHMEKSNKVASTQGSNNHSSQLSNDPPARQSASSSTESSLKVLSIAQPCEPRSACAAGALPLGEPPAHKSASSSNAPPAPQAAEPMPGTLGLRPEENPLHESASQTNRSDTPCGNASSPEPMLSGEGDQQDPHPQSTSATSSAAQQGGTPNASDAPVNLTSSSQAAGALLHLAPDAQGPGEQGGTPPVPNRGAHSPAPGGVSTDFIPRTQVRHRDSH